MKSIMPVTETLIFIFKKILIKVLFPGSGPDLQQSAGEQQMEQEREKVPMDTDDHEVLVDALWKAMKQSREKEEAEAPTVSAEPLASGSHSLRKDSMGYGGKIGIEPTWDSAYSTNRVNRFRNLATENLNAELPPSTAPISDSFEENEGKWHSGAHLVSSKGKGLNLTLSFDPLNGNCLGCGEKLDMKDMSSKVVVMGDQSYPPILPTAQGDGGCLTIIRVEYATIMELARLYVDLFAGAGAAGRGGVVLLVSVTHLSVVGLAAYTEDLVRAAKLIAERCPETRVFAGPPLLFAGLNNPDVVLSIFELGGWVLSFRDFRERVPLATWKKTLEVLTDRGVGNYLPRPSRMRLPISMNSWEKKNWASDQWANVPLSVAPLDHKTIQSLAQSLIAEMNSIFSLNLSLDIQTRGEGESAKGKASFIVVGASLAQRTAEALEAAGAEIMKISMPSWRPTPGTVASAAAELEAALATRAGCTVIFQMLDAAAYYAGCEDGSVIPMRRDPRGRYHVDGELVMATGDFFTRSLRVCLPLLKAAGNNNKLLLSPIPRYWKSSCCNDPEHVSNLLSPDFEDTLFKGLDDLRDTAKGYLRSCGVPSIKVLSTLQLMSRLPGSPTTSLEHRAAVLPLWGGDPVHPNFCLFEAAAKAILDLVKPLDTPAAPGSFLPRSCAWMTDTNWRQQARNPSSRGRGKSNPRHKPY
jgi:hypothetical protein